MLPASALLHHVANILNTTDLYPTVRADLSVVITWVGLGLSAVEPHAL